jgi:chorismate mutase
MELLDVRGQLSKMTDRIIMRLHDRAGFPRNTAVYERGAIKFGDGTQSLLEFALVELERYHALLGRYEFPDQHPLMDFEMPSPALARIIDATPLPYVKIALRDLLLPFYIDTVVPGLCEPGEAPGAYGETAYVDADLLELLNERINLGRQVAMTKIERDPGIRGLIHDQAALIEALRDSARESEVIASVRDAAGKYAVDADLAETLFRWVIDRTIDVEVAWLRGLE